MPGARQRGVPRSGARPHIREVQLSGGGAESDVTEATSPGTG